MSVIFVTSLSLSFASVVKSKEVVADSIVARNRQAPSKSFARKLLKAPALVLGVPVYAVKGMTYGVIYVGTESPLSHLLNFGRPAGLFYPIVGYSSNKGLSGGVGLRFRNLWTDDDRMKIKWYYSTHSYQRYKIKYSGDNYWGDNSSLQVVGSYHKRPREDFYGIGNESKETDEVNFTLEHFEIMARPGWNLNDNLSLGLELGYTSRNVYDGEDEASLRSLDSIQVRFGLLEEHFSKSSFISIGGRIEINRVDHPGRPSQGGMVSLLTRYNKGLETSSNIDYYYTRLEMAGYLNLFNNRILAARIMVQSIDMLDDDLVLPFYLMSGLGGLDNLRGYDSYRFIDKDAGFYSLEYRYPLWHILDAFLFLDGGHVFDDLSDDFTFAGWHSDYGVGLRLFNTDGVTFRMQTAFSRERTNFYLELGADW